MITIIYLHYLILFTDGDSASQILQHYSDRISQVSLTDSCIQLLYTEGLINEETQRKIERCGGSLSDSLRELMITVSENHTKLRSLGDILLKLEETKSVAQEMINDCGKNKSIGIIIVTIFFQENFFNLVMLPVVQLVKLHPDHYQVCLILTLMI